MEDLDIITKVGLFDTQPFKRMKRYQVNGISYRDTLIAVWYEILNLSALNEDIGILPYESDELAFILNRKENIVKECIKFYLSNFMIKKEDCGYSIVDFGTDKKNKYIVCVFDKRTSQKYKDWRLAVLERDNYTCQLCGCTNTPLHAHHKRLWAYYPNDRFDLDNGICLCATCHRNIHKENNDYYGKRHKMA